MQSLLNLFIYLRIYVFIYVLCIYLCIYLFVYLFFHLLHGSSQQQYSLTIPEAVCTVMCS